MPSNQPNLLIEIDKDYERTVKTVKTNLPGQGAKVKIYITEESQYHAPIVIECIVEEGDTSKLLVKWNNPFSGDRGEKWIKRLNINK